MTRKWSDYQGRTDDQDQANYWLGRSEHAMEEYRKGRALMMRAVPELTWDMYYAALQGRDEGDCFYSSYFLEGMRSMACARSLVRTDRRECEVCHEPRTDCANQTPARETEVADIFVCEDCRDAIQEAVAVQV